jgi:NAD(P)-dependent dehydrogenase (short-subunit alcohol dehydrogenase family)
VVVVYRSEGGRVQTEKRLKDQDGEGIFIQADVRKEEDWLRVMSATTKTYGRLDALFSNAGNNLIKPITEVGVEEWDDLFALNVRGVFLGAKHAIPLMIEGGGGELSSTWVPPLA